MEQSGLNLVGSKDVLWWTDFVLTESFCCKVKNWKKNHYLFIAAKKGNWDYENEKKTKLNLNLLKNKDLGVLKKMGLTDFIVDSDIQMVVKTEKVKGQVV